MTSYYNEFDPYAAQWLRNLIDAGLIAPGTVDTRSIVDVQPDDLAGYRQCHFFAGIGGWSLAARLAGWSDDRELWTGSAPCQPFSVAGQGKAQADDRHLWPHLARLVRARRPAVLMGEQVAAAVGKDWLDGVFADLEGIDYACGAAVVPACAVDAPHRRDRLWFVAHASGERRQQIARSSHGNEGAHEGRAAVLHHVAAGDGQGECALANADLQRRDGIDARIRSEAAGRVAGGFPEAPGRGAGGFWHGASAVVGHDGKSRRTPEPSIHLLAHGVPARVGRLRAYGNAIAPPLAAEVIGAFMDCYPEST